eukprot:Em0006g821a
MQNPIRDKALDAEKPCKDFQPSNELPTVKSAIGMLRYHLEIEMTNAIALMAVREVAKQVYAKYFHGMAWQYPLFRGRWKRNIRIALDQIEVQSLSLVVDMLVKEKEKAKGEW